MPSFSFASTLPSTRPAFEPSAIGQPVQVRDTEQAFMHRTLLLTLGLLSMACMALLLVIALVSDEAVREVWVVAALGLLGAVLQGTLRRQWLRAPTVAAVLVGALVSGAVISVLSYGSVRSGGSDLFLAAVVAAGVFLGRRQMVVVLVVVLALLGGLVWAEANGLLLEPTQAMAVGLRSWVSRSAILIGIGVMLMFAMAMQRELAQRAQHEARRRREADTQRDLSLARFSRVFQTSPMPLLAQSMRTGNILDANPAFLALMGYQRDEVLGRTDAFLWLNPPDRQHHAEQLMLWRRVHRNPTRLCHAAGHAVAVHLTSELQDHPQDKLLVTMVEPMEATGQQHPTAGA